MSGAVVEAAPAKVNLDLAVTGRRADGYHDLDSLVVFAALGDRLTLTPADYLGLEVEGPFAAGTPKGADNLVVRAARRLAAEAGIAPCAHIRLEKNLPVMAGLGGGSSDAAAALRGLARLWGLNFDRLALGEIGRGLGADVPVCVHARACRMRGLGERLDPVRGLPDLPIVLVNPGSPVSTAAAFGALDPAAFEPCRRPGLPVRASVVQFGVWLNESRNDLEAPATTLAPAIGAALDALRNEEGCVLARMSGSGATCFGLFMDETRRDRAAARLAAAWPRWWVAATTA